MNVEVCEIALVAIVLCGNLGQQSGTQDLALPESNLVIRSGFESSVAFANRTLSGQDHATSGPENNWDAMGDIRFQTLIQETGKIAIVADPVNHGNRVLQCEILTPNEKKGRTRELSISSTGVIRHLLLQIPLVHSRSMDVNPRN